MKSIFIEAKEWFDKTYGNSYFAARIEIDGQEVARLPFQYGYESMFEHVSLKWLQAQGLVSDDVRNLWQLREMGVTVYKTKSPAKYREVKAWGASC
jgi:hypothetical protein